MGLRYDLNNARQNLGTLTLDEDLGSRLIHLPRLIHLLWFKLNTQTYTSLYRLAHAQSRSMHSKHIFARFCKTAVVLLAGGEGNAHVVLCSVVHAYGIECGFSSILCHYTKSLHHLQNGGNNFIQMFVVCASVLRF